MKKLIYFYAAILVLAIGNNSCTRDNLEPIKIQSNSILGEKLENPYTMDVMEQAWLNVQAELKKEGRTSDLADITLTPTHYYIKFKPKNEEELDLLNADATLNLYGYPLDYEVFEGINNYRDPEVTEGQPTYQYAAVPVGHSVPNINYEKIADIFIPEDSPLFATARTDDPCMPQMITNEAMTITNNLEYLEPIDNDCGPNPGGGGGSVGCSYCPQGTMRVWDDTQNRFIPIVGLKVQARVFLNTKTAITNGAGKYIIRHNFSNKKQYSFKWKRDNFTIRDNPLDAAETIGPKTKGWWSVDFRGGISQFHGTIFRAAYHYYYGNINGLRRPPLNNFWHTRLKIRAYNETNSDINGSHCAACRFIGLGSAIKIYNNTTKPTYNTDDLYGTVVHELAHASHWSMDGNNYNNGDGIVVESWARGVQWELTRMIYPNYRPDYFGSYTGVVEDLRDGIIPNDYDQVEGYSIRQVEDALVGQRTFINWRNNIKNNYANTTKNNLDALFNYWD